VPRPEKKHRLEDVPQITRAALEEGIMLGGVIAVGLATKLNFVGLAPGRCSC
jgi:hypothetical protein